MQTYAFGARELGLELRQAPPGNRANRTRSPFPNGPTFLAPTASAGYQESEDLLPSPGACVTSPYTRGQMAVSLKNAENHVAWPLWGRGGR